MIDEILKSMVDSTEWKLAMTRLEQSDETKLKAIKDDLDKLCELILMDTGDNKDEEDNYESMHDTMPMKDMMTYIMKRSSSMPKKRPHLEDMLE